MSELVLFSGLSFSSTASTDLASLALAIQALLVESTSLNVQKPQLESLLHATSECLATVSTMLIVLRSSYRVMSTPAAVAPGAPFARPSEAPFSLLHVSLRLGVEISSPSISWPLHLLSSSFVGLSSKKRE